MIHVDPKSSVPVFLQIVQEVKAAIARGRYQTDEAIPSVRQMAAEIIVNPNTVARAYRQLEREGVIYTRRGLGVFVHKDARAACSGDRREAMQSRLAELAAEASRAGISETEIRKSLDHVLRDGLKDDPDEKRAAQ